MRIFSRDPVEVRDLVPPVRMYRKDPRSMIWEAIRAKAEKEAAAAAAAAAVAAGEESSNAMDTEDANATTAANAAVAADGGKGGKPGQRKKKMRPGDSIDTSVIAPYGGAAVNRRNLFKKRTRQVFLSKESTEVREERRRDNYPWCLEDFDGSHSFTGDLMGNQGTTAKYALFFFSEDGFRVVMADKWYRFTPKPKHRILTAEEAEEFLQSQKKKENDRWLMHRFGKKDEEGEEGGGSGETSSKANESGTMWRGAGGGYRRDTSRRAFRTVDRGESSLFTDDEDDDGSYKRKKVQQRGDIDELDFDIDQDFQDDEEGTQDLEQQDEETKEATRRQKDNYLLAEKSDAEEDLDDAEDSSKDKNGEKLSSAGKEMRKIVRGIEQDAVYESDNEKDPYADSGDEEEEADSETETEKNKETNSPADSNANSKRKVPGSPSSQNGKRVKNSNSNAGNNHYGDKQGKRPLDSMDEDSSDSDSPSGRASNSAMNNSSNQVKRSRSSSSMPTSTLIAAASKAAPTGSTNASSSSSAAAAGQGDIQEHEVVALISRGDYDIKQIISVFRSRIQGHPERASRLKSIILAVAQTKDGKLILRKKPSSQSQP
ncbi:hypothetical protein BDF22DRAFT_674217 [Syncephalis plumigaleata]|nr:hypothetical protein BDF22DRAFT_674217 [Syncephalis plumigaleata]